jgi:asparagine synthase (glutamine-hydrolysing)
LGHQRLSIIDLSDAGNQPMQSNSGRYILTYNGEIYNHLEIRKELEKNNSNIKWQGNSDTETLLEAIDFWGIEKH